MRDAVPDDVPQIVAMLADDPLGATRESPDDLRPYYEALTALTGDPSQRIVVAERGGEVVGTLQLSFLRGLGRRGATRAQIEAVRVRRDLRGDGLGSTMIQWAVDEARAAGCHLVQLTSDASREGAHRFYERLGFTASHVGFKLTL
ncbi:GNAT family N-acetyltransferase [Mumia sp. zg.B53]|uniref:GNAT family N-acetyltransferase n=1 Tax=unclassified Mumia TaxID=2621872 RepID=UPI001C6EE7ED|nr:MULTISPECIES: GNAT family N-acetyltransferase [unclassified Mumia]MBW9206542.1 GNAT family N-acetyltransferase [Mumia sp. zg.B17]MBW9211169.1 GNAT family N-acetyltransferase [Mumia sp. zg.B21]MBW9215743.1 GNAT family N-acetyltransferase [Mumia sp. zg.B53]MDD9348130.1 GNAT family N-acetyltransferase [Mumia sp.]